MITEKEIMLYSESLQERNLLFSIRGRWRKQLTSAGKYLRREWSSDSRQLCCLADKALSN